MIAAHHVRVDLRGADLLGQRLRHQHVVDPPADVPGAAIGALAPPRVVAVALGEQPEGVDEARVEERLETGALFGGEALVPDVGLGIREVEFRVRLTGAS